MPQDPAGASPGEPLDSTALLLAQARAGDESARNRLFARFLPLLRGWARRRLPLHARDLAETDDLVQVTLMRALARLDAFEARREGAFLAYLRTILLNSVREELRRSRRRGTRLELDAELPDSRPSLVEQFAGRRTMERYEAALVELDDAQRQAVILRLEFGYAWDAIAEATGAASAAAARMQVSRALRALAERIDGTRAG